MFMRFFAAGLMLTAMSHSASTHHAFVANFEEGNIGSVEGQVEEIFWANPHVHFYIQVESENGSRELWDVEWGNLSNMSRRGWARGTLNVGDIIRVTGTLGRDGNRRIWPDEVMRLNGPALP